MPNSVVSVIRSTLFSTCMAHHQIEGNVKTGGNDKTLGEAIKKGLNLNISKINIK